MDRTTKLLLAAIAAALWALLLRPFWAVPTASAAVSSGAPSALAPAPVAVYNGEVFITQNGRLYVYEDVGAGIGRSLKFLLSQEIVPRR